MEPLQVSRPRPCSLPPYATVSSDASRLLRRQANVETQAITLDTPLRLYGDYWTYNLIRTYVAADSLLYISWLGDDANTHIVAVNPRLLFDAPTATLASPNIGERSNRPQSPKTFALPSPIVKTSVLENVLLYSFVVHDGGITGLFAPVRSKTNYLLYNMPVPSLSLARYDFRGQLRWETELVGDTTLTNLWSRQFEPNFGNSACVGTQLAWSGKYYSAIYPHHTHCEDGVTHQMDGWCIADTNGLVGSLTRWASWVSGHSLAQRVTYDCGSFLAISANDAYPRAISFHILNPNFLDAHNLDSIFYNHSGKGEYYDDAFYNPNDGLKNKELFPISGAKGDNDIRGTQLGGLIPTKENVVVTFCSAEGRGERGLQDAGVIVANRHGTVQRLRWLTETPELAETNVRTAWIGEGRMIAIWDVFEKSEPPEKFAFSGASNRETTRDWRYLYSQYLLIDELGNALGKPVSFDEGYARESVAIAYRRAKSYNCVTLPNGDVLIVRMTKDDRKLDVTRFRLQ